MGHRHGRRPQDGLALARSPSLHRACASATQSPDYHGPGRGAGHSIKALLDGHRLTGERRFLDKAEQLIRRCVHPADDIDRLDLLDAERRWLYTVFLQALGKYLDDKTERGEIDAMYAYARAALLHYARWMAQHERPYLDQPREPGVPDRDLGRRRTCASRTCSPTRRSTPSRPSASGSSSGRGSSSTTR